MGVKDDARRTKPIAEGGPFEMKIKVVAHEAEEGRYWAEVPAIPGCATPGDTFEELLQNLYEAVEGCLSSGEATR
jgi:predicted RNase H-like HicB family nuclease